MSSVLLMVMQVTLAAPPGTTAEAVRDTVRLPTGLELRIRDAIGRQWGVPSERIVVAVTRGPDSLKDDTPFELRGGTGGRFVVSFRPVDASPVTVALRAGARQNVSIARRSLLAGQVIDSLDIRLGERTVWDRPDPDVRMALPGWMVRANIPAGHAVLPPSAVPPMDVVGGARIDVVWKRGPVEITVGGVALNAGRVGQTIHVRLDNQRGRARATVLGPGRALLES